MGLVFGEAAKVWYLRKYHYCHGALTLPLLMIYPASLMGTSCYFWMTSRFLEAQSDYQQL